MPIDRLSLELVLQSVIQRDKRRGSVPANGPNGGPGSRRVFFPAKKQVSYRQPLEEEIQTVRYTARHSDITTQPNPESHEAGSGEDSDSNTSAEPSDASTTDEDVEAKSSNNPLKSFGKKKRKHLSAEKQIRASSILGLEPYIFVQHFRAKSQPKFIHRSRGRHK
ncbi:hypothetical protein APSETT445_008756 [Aspergillus pseudonomiae]